MRPRKVGPPRAGRFGQRALALFSVLCLGASLAGPCTALELDEARELLELYYVDEIPERVLALDSLDQVLTALGDPYTSYFTPQQYQSFLSGVQGERLVGIGVVIENLFQDGYRILSVLPDSPAQSAGLRSGDKLVEVDGVVLDAQRNPADAIRGEEGTTVRVTVLRGDGERITAQMTRQLVTAPIVSFEMSDHAAVITCDSFGDSTAVEVERIVRAQEEHASIFVVDLRRNPGGTVDAAVESAGIFAGAGTMTLFRDRDGVHTPVDTHPDREDLTDKPTLILTSAQSASGSELFTAAMRDYGAGVAVGQRTFGKGVAQVLLDRGDYPDYFSDGDAMKITTYRYFSPQGATNDTIGVFPYLMVTEENTQRIALLLAAEKQEKEGMLRFLLGGQTFYLDADEASERENLAAFTELLEALPPSARIERFQGGLWQGVSAREVAKQQKLPYLGRGFTDARDSAFSRALDVLAVYGVVHGYGDGTFRPAESVSRAEFCSMVASALNLPAPNGAASFSDVPEGAWFTGSVNALANRGFLSGYEDGTFRPDRPISCEEVAAVLDHMAVWACVDGCRVRDEEASLDALDAFHPWARRAVWELEKLGVRTLEAVSSPASPAPRDLTAQLLYETMCAAHLFWGESVP